MADLFDTSTGKLVSVEAEEAAEGLRSGRLEAVKGRRVPVVDSSGNVSEIDPSENQDFLKSIVSGQNSDWRIAGATERRRALASEREAETAALSGLQGALDFGPAALGTEIIRKAGLTRRQQENIAANPVAAELGGAAGTLVNPVSLAAGPLAGSALRGAATATRFASAAAGGRGLARAAMLAERAREVSKARTIGTAVERAIGTRTGVGRVVGTAVGGAAEGVFENVNRVFSEDALGSAELTGERLAAAGLSGLTLGGTAGLGAGILGEGVAAAGRSAVSGGKAVRAKVSDWAESLRQRAAAQGVDVPEDVAIGIAEDHILRATRQPGFREQMIQDHVSGQKAAAVRVAENAAKWGPEGSASRKFLEEGESAAREAAPIIREVFDAHERGMSKALDLASVEHKLKHVATEISTDAADQAAAEAVDLMGKVQRLMGEIGSKEGSRALGMTPTIGKRILGEYEAIEARVLAGFADGTREGLADAFGGLDQLKRTIGRNVKKMRKAQPMVAEEFDTLYHGIRDHLERVDLYGKAAKTQRGINHAWTQYLGNARHVEREFLRPSGVAEGFDDILTADPDKIAAFIERVGSGKGQLSHEQLIRHAVTTRGMLEAMEKHYTLPASTRAAMAEIKGANDKLLRELDGSLKKVIARNLVKEAEDGLTRSIAGNVGAGIGGAAGVTLGGFPGGVIGTSIGSLGGQAMVSRAKRIEALTKVDRVAAFFADKLEKAPAQLIEALTEGDGRPALDASIKALRAAGGVAKTGARVGGRTALDTLFRQKVEAVLDATASPEAMQERLASYTTGLADAAPNVSQAATLTAARAVNFLRSKIPPEMLERPGLQPHIFQATVSDAEMDKFLTYARAVEDPTSIIEDLRDRTLTQEAVDALREVYPGVYAKIQANAMEALSTTKTPIPYDDRIQLGILLDIPADPSLEPGFIAAMQSIGSENPEAEGESAEGLAPSQRVPPDISGAAASGVQALEQRRAAR